MTESLDLLKAAACIGIFWRTYTYQWPAESKPKWGITTIAYALMFIVGAQALCLILENKVWATFLDAAFYVCVLILVLLAKGNIADIVRIKWDGHWRGEERRREGRERNQANH